MDEEIFQILDRLSPNIIDLQGYEQPNRNHFLALDESNTLEVLGIDEESKMLFPSRWYINNNNKHTAHKHTEEQLSPGKNFPANFLLSTNDKTKKLFLFVET